MRTTSLCIMAFLVVGCAATAPQYYSLADTTTPPRVAAASGAAPAYIELAPIDVPERFARPQMVVRGKGAAVGTEVDILEQHLWASSFETELRDALGNGIAARLGAVDTTRFARPRGQPALRIAVQLRQLDAVEGARVDASFSWTMRNTESTESTKEGATTACQLSLSEPVGSGIGALAQGTQRVTARLSDAIARSAVALRANPGAACAT
jgi:uncharacterized lipoprotein YmbA